MGGVLPKLGWDQNDFNNYLNRAETDTAWEGYQQRKKLSQQGQVEAAVAGSSSLPPMQGQKRPSDAAPTAGRSKKSRADEERPNGFNGAMSSMSGPSSLPYPQETRPMDRSNMFSELMRGPSNNTMFSQPSPSTSNTASPYGNITGNMENYSNSYLTMPPLNQPMHQQQSYTPQSGSSSQARNTPLSTAVSLDDPELDDDSSKSEAYKLIQYVAISDVQGGNAHRVA